MTLQTPGFDASYLFRLLSDFWDTYKERDQVSVLWGGMSQVVDDMYIQQYQADLSKSLETVPVYWRYNWANLQFDNWQSNEVFHRHLWVESTTVAGTTAINLDDFFTPPDSSGTIRTPRVLLDGIVQQEGVDYQVTTNLITFVEPLTGGRNMMIQWADVSVPIPYHMHKEFRETLAGTKANWTDAQGDAFDPEGAGPYQFNDPEAPIELWINGVRENNNRYVEPSSVLFQLNVVTPPASGDWIVLRWSRTMLSPNPHVHYKYNRTISSKMSNITLPFYVLSGLADVYVNGVMQIPDVDYEFSKSNLLHMAAQLEVDDLLEVEYYQNEYKWRHVIDPAIVSAPTIQDGIDKPNVVSVQGETHAITRGELYSDYQFTDVWVPNLWVDDGNISNNFGSPIDFPKTKSNIPYLQSTRGLWYVYWHGPAVANIEAGAKIMSNVPVSPSNTTVVKITRFSDGSSSISLADGNVFSVEAPLSPIVSAGDKVTTYQGLASGVLVWDYINKPDWWKYIPGLHSLWGRFSTSEEAWVGNFDDRGTFDDGGFFDDAGIDPGTEKDFFDKIKYFLWILLVDSSLLKTSDDTNDLINFANTIKPAYTDYLALAEHTPKDYIAFTDSVTLELSLTP